MNVPPLPPPKIALLPPAMDRFTIDQEIERVVKRVGWIWALVATLAGALVWAFSLGVASTRYVTNEQRAADLTAEKIERERLAAEIRTISERITRIEERVNGMNETMREIKEKLDRSGIVVRNRNTP